VCFILKELGLRDRINDLVERDEVRYKKQSRDVRLNTDKIRLLVVVFLDSKEALKSCLKDLII